MERSLFNLKNVAATRKGMPETSQDAADGLNAVDAVTKQEREVLAALGIYGPCTAKWLGLHMAQYLTCQRNVPLSMEFIKEIIAEARKPHSRLKALLDDEKVTMTERKGGNVYQIAESKCG